MAHRSGNGRRNRERRDGRTVLRWEWVYRCKSGKRWSAVVATLNDRGTVNVLPRRPHLIPPAARMEAAERLGEFLEQCPHMKPMLSHEQRYRLIWG